jgi:hypothetical protein
MLPALWGDCQRLLRNDSLAIIGRHFKLNECMRHGGSSSGSEPLASTMEALFAAVYMEAGDAQVDLIMEKFGMFDFSLRMLKLYNITKPAVQETDSSAPVSMPGRSRRRVRADREIAKPPNKSSCKSMSRRDPDDRDWNHYPSFKTTDTSPEQNNWWKRIFG